MTLSQHHVDTVLGVVAGTLPATGGEGTSLIQRSWLRCVERYGLDPARRPDIRIENPSRVRECIQQNEEYLRVARAGMEQLYKHVSDLGYVLLLTDAEGIGVDYIGNDTWDIALRRAGLTLGANWSELYAGTNGIGTCLAERIRPMPGARTLVATLRHHGCRTVLVTGGFHHFADPVAEDIGFERVVGNRLVVENARLSGGLHGAIMDPDGKERVLREEISRLGADAVSLATGDGANDVPMIAAATYGVAYHAKPRARSAASGWIDRGDLTAILKLLGIPEHDWMAG
jgi:HAD superfamily phosphoserine phosphatase-like hydrolase